MSQLTIRYNDFDIIEGKKYNLNDVQNKPIISFKPGNTLKTIIMIDPDAPSRLNPIYKYWLHYLIVNNKDIVIPYEPPTPPKKSGPHRYQIYLLSQKDRLDPVKIRNSVTERKNFNFNNFIEEYGLTIIYSTYFITENDG